MYFGLTLGVMVLGIILQLILSTIYPTDEIYYRNYVAKETKKIHVNLFSQQSDSVVTKVDEEKVGGNITKT